MIEILGVGFAVGRLLVVTGSNHKHDARWEWRLEPCGDMLYVTVDCLWKMGMELSGLVRYIQYP